MDTRLPGRRQSHLSGVVPVQDGANLISLLLYVMAMQLTGRCVTMIWPHGTVVLRDLSEYAGRKMELNQCPTENFYRRMN
jgi:hypothetical protein